jgi:uncharacterized membrane protein (DUF106 family)
MKKRGKKELPKRELIERLKTEVNLLKEEIRHDVTGPVVASFGFIIALIWRDALRSILDEILGRAGLLQKAYIYDVLSAIIVTIFVIIIMVMITRLSRSKKRKKIQRVLNKKINELKE